MTRGELARFIGLCVRFNLVERDERCDRFDVLHGIDNDAAMWGGSLGIQFIPLDDIRSVEVKSRNVLPHLFEEARAKLTAAGFTFGPEMRGAMLAVRRSPGDIARCWIDTVNTVRIAQEPESDPTGALFNSVNAALK